MTPKLAALLAATELLTRRLRILQKLQLQCRERGETHIDLAVDELCEPADLEAIAAWEKAFALAVDAQPLPFDGPAGPSDPSVIYLPAQVH